jgi:hypothetical protein
MFVAVGQGHAKSYVGKGLANVSIEVYLTATGINLKRPATFLLYFSGYVTLCARHIASIWLTNAHDNGIWSTPNNKTTGRHLLLKAA